MRKFRIGISSCLLGNRVRYNGDDKFDADLVARLGGMVEWFPVCPETECGLPTPRKPIQAVQTDAGIRLLEVDGPDDHTEQLRRFCRKRLSELAGKQLDGFILKAKSPSCGVAIPLFDPEGRRIGETSGIFAGVLLETVPELPVAEAESLHAPGRLEQFLEKLKRR